MSDKRDKFTAGFTIAELLIALVITGILLAAVTVAFNASVRSYGENEDIFKTINTARQALLRITSQLRTGLVDPNDILSEDKCTLLCADGSKIKYWYDNGNNSLYLYDYDKDEDYLLCDNVTDMTFKRNNDTPTGDVKSVQISITVASGDIERTVSAAAVVRKILD